LLTCTGVLVVVELECAGRILQLVNQTAGDLSLHWKKNVEKAPVYAVKLMQRRRHQIRSNKKVISRLL